MGGYESMFNSNNLYRNNQSNKIKQSLETLYKALRFLPLYYLTPRNVDSIKYDIIICLYN